MPPLDPDHCYLAVERRDHRFDGWFVTAVRTTGIYCRPSCPAITPKRANVDFFPSAAAAQQHGFRACKRCRPDASPGSPEWNSRHDVVARTMRLVADGVVEREGVSGLARRIGYSERHLNRVFTDELGAGPLAVARAQRAHTARLLVETTSMALTDVAFAAGFGSVRQFNDTIREVFASSPTDLRRAAAAASADRPVPGRGVDGALPIDVRLPVREPFAAGAVMAFIGERAVPGCEAWDGTTYRRSLDLPGGAAVAALTAHDDHVLARLRLTAWADLGVALQRLRRLLDLDADPVAVDAALASHPALAPSVRRAPGRRAPASVDPFETAVRAVIGQQVSVAAARTVAGRIVEVAGSACDDLDSHEGADGVGVDRVGRVDGAGGVDGADGADGHGNVEHVGGVVRLFPRPDQLASAPDDAFSMPGARRDTLRRLATAVADGAVELHVGVDPADARTRLLELRGIGPWTADYVVMRGLGHPDMFLGADLGVRHALDRLGLTATASEAWAPWRSYAVHHLWASLAPEQEATT